MASGQHGVLARIFDVEDEIIEKRDPRGNAYYWIGTGNPSHVGDADSDVKSAHAGWISVTPIHTDVTAHDLRRSRPLRALAGLRFDG